MAALSAEEKKIRFTKFWQAAQLSEDRSANDAVPIAMMRAGSTDKTPEFFRGDTSIASIDSLDPTSKEDLEKAVVAFRDPFLLNKAFIPGKAADSASKETSAMDVDAAPGQFAHIDLPLWREWLEKVESFADAEDTCMDAADRPSYSERILESFGDLSSAIERGLCKTYKGDEEARKGYPDVPPSFLDSPYGLRFLALILFHPSLADPDSYASWHRILRAFRILNDTQRDILATWLADSGNVGIDTFREMLQNLEQLITITFLSEFASEDMPADAQEEPDNIPDGVWDFFVMRCAQKCKNALSCIDIFWKANLKRREAVKQWHKARLVRGAAAMLGTDPPQALKDEEFFNDALNSVERVLQHEFKYSIFFEHIEREHEPFFAGTPPKKPKSLKEIEKKAMLNNYSFGLLAYDFCLDASNKCRFLMFDAATRQREEMSQEIRNQVLSGNRRVNPYFTLKVKRDNIVQDTLQRVTNLPPAEFRKKLRVAFEGEAGVDEGGVKKEFFQLLVEQLYDPNYAMFNYNSSNKTYWFNPGSFESNLQFEMFGVLLGLAIYNTVILDIRFPTIVYQKLLAEDPFGNIECSIDTLVDIQPDMAKSLLGMLEFEGNVEEVYCRNFVATYENFGAVVEVPLKEGGENIPVTNENRGEYVDLYVDWFFNGSIRDKFRSFKRGFLRCMEVEEEKPAADSASPPVRQAQSNMFLKLFRPAELELLICGSQVLDFNEWKNNTDYTDGYEAGSDQCKWFWEIAFDSFDDEQRRELLIFVTGSDRAPPKGLGAPEARLTISRQSPDSDSLPTSHTCFNHILFPEYSSKEKLEAKLKLAMKYNQGFGLI
eukprot:TRINITY_DN34032_c0_g1_i1.p1 TRINITY_DN34032_c0_g1~~TRINITY_DN34032_c0_g1_i1.p1  ORF type:complete len:831 (-),score=236.30 TRINITY_DN34032_c0_g1_i1:94-2586(-)